MKAACPFCAKELPLVPYDTGPQNDTIGVTHNRMHLDKNEKWDSYYFCKALPLYNLLEQCTDEKVTFDAFVEDVKGDSEKDDATKRYVFTYTPAELKKWLESLLQGGKRS